MGGTVHRAVDRTVRVPSSGVEALIRVKPQPAPADLEREAPLVMLTVAWGLLKTKTPGRACSHGPLASTSLDHRVHLRSCISPVSATGLPGLRVRTGLDVLTPSEGRSA